MIIIIIIIIIVIINSVKISAGRYTKEERGKLERRWSDRDVKKNETFYVWRPLLKAGGEKAKKKEEKKGKKEKTLRHRTCHPDWIFFLLCGFPFSFRKKKINEEFQGKFQEEPLWVVPSLSLDFHWWWYTMVFFFKNMIDIIIFLFEFHSMELGLIFMAVGWILGFDGRYWRWLGNWTLEFGRFLLFFTGFYRVILSFHWFHYVLLDFTWLGISFHRLQPSFAQDFIVFLRVVLGFNRLNWVFPFFFSFN